MPGPEPTHAQIGLHRPLTVAAAALATGIAAGGFLPGQATAAAALAAPAAIGTLLAVAGRRCALLLPLLLLVASGYLAVQPWEVPRPAPRHVGNRIGSGPMHITAEVTDRLRSTPDRQRLTVRVVRAGPDRGMEPAGGLLRLTVHGDGPVLSAGDRLRFRAALRPIHNFDNPGGFDYRAFLRRQGILAAAHVRAGNILALHPAAGSGMRAWRDRVRSRICDLIRANAPARASGLLQALVTGDRSDLPPDLRTAFSRAGTGHLLAISGLHIGIVASAVYLVAVRLLVLVPLLLELAWTRRLAALAAMTAVLFYAGLAGWSSSTQRAVLMTAAVLATLAVPRRPDTPSSLALAAIVILAAHPPALFGISFQLSFSAVAFILLGLQLRSAPDPLERLTGGPSTVKTWVATFLKVTCWAVLGTLPLAACHFNLVSLVGIPVNLLVVPPAGYLVVPVGLLGTLVSLISPAAAGPLFSLAGLILAPLVDLVQWVAGLSFAALWTVTPSAVEIAGYYLLLVSGAAWFHFNAAPVTTGGRDPRHRALTVARWSVAAALLILAVDAAWWVHRRWFDPRLRVTCIDVGQGSATLLELPGGRVWLVDGGGFSGRSTFDVGARVVAPVLWRKKIRTIDTVVLSHPNSDHLNGLLFILEHFTVRQFWSNGQPADTDGYRRLQATLRQDAIQAPAFDDLPRHQSINGAAVELLYPPVGFRRRTHTGPWKDANNNSIVLKCTLGAHSVLLPGDIMAPAERELVRLAAGRLPSTVLAAPHHGSRTSSTPGFVKAVRPQFVVVSAGKANRFRMPHPDVVQRYRRHGVTPLRIDLKGAVAVVTDGSGLTVFDSTGPQPFDRKP